MRRSEKLYSNSRCPVVVVVVIVPLCSASSFLCASNPPPFFYHQLSSTIRMIPLTVHLFCLVLTVFAHQSTAQDVYDKTTCDPGAHDVPNLSPDPDAQAPDQFFVQWYTTASDQPIVLQVTREWSPNGVDRFYQLIKDNYYNCATFFRVVPGEYHFVLVYVHMRLVHDKPHLEGCESSSSSHC